MGTQAVQARSAGVAIPPQGVYDPFEDPGGWTAVPNVFQSLREGKLSGEAQGWLIVHLMRELWGHRKRGLPLREWTDPLTYEQLAAECGSVSVRMMQEIVDDAVRRGLLLRERRPPKGRSYCFKLLPGNWATAPDYDPLFGKETKPVQEVEAGKPLLLLPGQRSKPMTLESAVQRVRFRSSSQVTVTAGVVTGGTLSVEIQHNESQGEKLGEGTAKRAGSALPSRSAHVADNSRNGPNDLAVMRDLLNRHMRGRLGPADDATARACLAGIGTGKTYDFTARLVARTRGKDAVTWGLVIEIARDIGKMAGKEDAREALKARSAERAAAEVVPEPLVELPPETPEEIQRKREENARRAHEKLVEPSYTPPWKKGGRP